MKNRTQESKLCQIRQYHRNKRWRLSAGGLMIPHAYPKPRALSWWDDVGFILNGRRVMVWWVHPRMKYADAIEDAAFAEVSKSPRSTGDMFDDSKCTKRYKRLGRSRKKVILYQSPLSSPETKAYYQQINASIDSLSSEGIDFVVRPSMSIKRLDWCIGVDLCLPMEVLAEDDVKVLAGIVRQMLKNGRSLAALEHLFPKDYQYDREQWLGEAVARQQDRERRFDPYS